MLSFSQHIGNTKEEIVKHLIGENIVPQELYDSDWGYYLYVENDSFKTIYVFNNVEICIYFYIIPIDLEVTKVFIKNFDNNDLMFKKNTTTWWWYTKNIVIEIKLNKESNVFILKKKI